MALTITAPDRLTPAYNPVIILATSDVRSDYTIGSIDDIDTITSNAGFVQLALGSGGNTYLKGDYILIVNAPGAEYLLGVALITKVVSLDTYVINKPFVTGLTSTGQLYKYLNNYSAYLKFYVYTEDAPSTAKFAGDKILKPKFEGGFCKFIIDMAGMIKDFNYDDFTPSEVLKYDLIPANQYTFVNKKSFVIWGYELTEAFDNAVGGNPVFESDIDA